MAWGTYRTGKHTRPRGETRRLVEQLKKQGLKHSEIAAQLGVACSCVTAHAKRIAEKETRA